MAKIEKLWCEKHRPQVIDDIIFKDDQVKNKFREMIKKKEIPNLLFGGVQGSGKTTLSRVLVNQIGIHEADVITINASSSNGIDFVRDTITGFARTMPLGDFKVIQLEEFNRLSPAAQEGLRVIIEDNSDTCRFITTTNYINKVIPSLKSRFQEYQFSAPDKDQVLIYAADILEKENVVFDFDVLEKFVSVAYPDIRKIVQLLQQYTQNNKLKKPDSSASSNDDYRLKLIELVEKNDFFGARDIVCGSIELEEYDDLYAWLYQNIKLAPKFKDVSLEHKAIVLIADHLSRHAIVAHPHIVLGSLFIQLGNL